MRSHWSLLCLTDLHYESQATFEDDAKERPGGAALRDNIFDSFYRIIEQGFTPGSIDLIAVGGDITTRGSEKGLSQFQEQALGRLQDLLGNRNAALCLVPGNHDVPYGIDPTGRKSYDSKFKAFAQVVRDAQATSSLFPSGQLDEKDDTKLSFVPPANGPIFIDQDRKLLALCINSAVRCNELHTAMKNDLIKISRKALKARQKELSFDTNDNLLKLRPQILKYLVRDVPHVTQKQRHMLANELTARKEELGDDWDSYLKIAILHHHLVPFRHQTTEHKSYAQLLDSAQMLDLLTEFDFDLVMTGHKHQPYQEHYWHGKSIVVIGGPTLGGYTHGAFRGIRHIEVEDKGERRYFKVTDIPYQEGNGNVSNNIKGCKDRAVIIVASRAEQELRRQSQKAGFYYQEVTSMTVLNLNGDAKRTVEFNDLIYLDKHCERRSRHKISLPPTSGHLCCLRARNKDLTEIKLQSIPRGSREHSKESMLVFGFMIGLSPEEYKPDISQGYKIEWQAINAFALNKQQWAYKYSPDTQWPNLEFTHFAPEEPIKELTILVQFPSAGVGLKSQPQPRVVIINPNESDRRNWQPDYAARESLIKEKALKYFDSSGVAILKVRCPQLGLSYGIQWEVEDAPEFHGNDQARIRKLWNRFNLLGTHPLTEFQHAKLMECLGGLINEARSNLLRNLEWDGPLDAGVMYFDGQNSLVRLIAANQEKRDGELKELLYDKQLRYGDGIAGVALKINSLCDYVDLGEKLRSDEPDLYTPILEDHKHAVLMSFPLHIPIPLSPGEKKIPNYQAKPPYAVFSLGSTSTECPLIRERKNPFENILLFQQNVKTVVWEAISNLATGQ